MNQSRLPDPKANPHPTEVEAQPSDNVIVRVESREGYAMDIGRYLHGIESWRVDGISGDAPVVEWWPMPEPGTGTMI
ncbi:hypothetical protein [Marinobacter salsuginis]|jgi:hypothetical protein|uniref:DUF551 domain-containing protein n=1 Tax=Marinobacter salsuginis TaxID=418719 RepID=A0A5M3Q3G5_9GAMM|nr:hypothetical protein [Marinobacter salsuginis]GBO89190.1 hypothetical protein MSSD14B_28580 [Marinobacter salsuginis]